MDLKKLFDYDLWANEKIFQAIQQLEEGEAKAEVEEMFSHILAAQKIWIDRIQNKTPQIEVWPELNRDEVDELIVANNKSLIALISEKEKQLGYKNSKGKAHDGKTEDILMHVVIHGQHHRAQIAKMLREAGVTSPGTDFLFFIREN